ncbi:MAG TPA: tRNA-(ms[2]io[6]A)-hydroxylase [Candidatus Kapabacteria bacterium]|nr:tRNA-(ms[2]io[6]A)-hydroxylase [Candidatus Kapabacteria bacterium]
MLGLRCASSEEWIASVNEDPQAVLSDHAHCEKKAAAMAISFINRYTHKPELVRAMAELAQEEMSHFAMVLDKLDERGYTLDYDAGDEYVQQLHSAMRKNEPHRLLDALIVSSLIEARSCERFSLLSEHCTDEDLKTFYRSLLESEAKHRSEFLKLARLYYKRETVDARLKELSEIEAQIVTNLQNAATMHG